MQEICSTLSASNMSDPVVDAMASLGGKSNKSAVEAEFQEWMRVCYGIELEPYSIRVRVTSSLPGRLWQYMYIAVIPIYEIWSAIYNLGHAVFSKCALGSRGLVAVQEYWENARRLEWGQHHPVLNALGDSFFALPLYYHTDGATIFHGGTYNVYSSSSPFATGLSVDTKFPWAMVETGLFYDRWTEEDLQSFCNWCGEVLASGVWPSKGYEQEEFSKNSYRYRMGLNNERLMGPWVGAFAGWKGDLEAKVTHHGFFFCEYNIRRFTVCFLIKNNMILTPPIFE